MTQSVEPGGELEALTAAAARDRPEDAIAAGSPQAVEREVLPVPEKPA